MNAFTAPAASAPTIAIGQAAYLLGRYNRTKVSVLRITPKGKIVVGSTEELGVATATFEESTSYHGAHNEYRPSSFYARDYRTLRFDVAAVEFEAAQTARQYAAADALNDAADSTSKVGRAWDKVTLLEHVVALEAKVAAARALVEAI